MPRFQLDPNRENLTVAQSGREFNLRLAQRAQAIFNTMMQLLPSNWISTVKGPNYTVELNAVATELARLELALEDINTDQAYATVRTDFLYQTLGYLLFNGQLPVMSYTDTEFRKFFITLVGIYFQGAVPNAIEAASNLLFDSLATTYENFLLVRQGASGLNISDEFGFRIDIACDTNEFPPDTFMNDAALRMILQIIRPAHTLYQLRYVFKDIYPAENITDTSNWQLDNYYYEDFRAYWDGLRDRDTLGRKLSTQVQGENHSKDLAPDSGTLLDRTLYMHKGPLVKPPLVIAQGQAAVVNSAQVVTLPGANILPQNVGMYVQLSGTGHSDGIYKIVARINSTQVQLCASFTVPDTALGWELTDIRNGQIANIPEDVVVRVNGTPVQVAQVTGLLGRIVLAVPPARGADIRADYYWVPNPTVGFMQLNRREFRLNSWNSDVVGLGHNHKYRYNNVLLTPSNYTPASMLTTLPQPLQRAMHYRAFERKYTAVLNDPTALLLNAPWHQIAYPQMSRPLESLFVPYEALSLPEQDKNYPWQRKGTGLASVTAGILTIVDTSIVAPIFWERPLDLTFPAVYMQAWRMQLTLVTTPEGVFTGVAAGFTGPNKAVIIGYLLVAGVSQLGILVNSDHPEDLASWAGGLDSSNNPTHAPVTVDWAVQHSYRVLRDNTGTTRVFLDGGSTEVLRVTDADLPALEGLDAPWDALAGVFFGAISRPARSTSCWDFVRYQVEPTNPQQTAAAIYVQYNATRPPEQDLTAPWTLVGAHGTETISADDYLWLDSTSATESAVGLVDGAFRGFLRFEPLLKNAASTLLDVRTALTTCTHGIAPNAVMAAVSDGTKLAQLCFFPDVASPKFSYGGRVLPTDFKPYNWQVEGVAKAYILGQVLRIEDTTTSVSCVYSVKDLVPLDSVDRVIGYLDPPGSFDYYLEARLQVISYTAEYGGSSDPCFAGATFQAYDGHSFVGLMLCTVNGVRQIALHSDGIVLQKPDLSPAVFDYAWTSKELDPNSVPHTYRLVKHSDYVSIFVDNKYIGGLAYASFHTSTDLVGAFSFGSATHSSNAAISTVDWYYANAWRNTVETANKFVGVWKGTDPNSLTGYYLPLKCSGTSANIQGNSLGDLQGDFSEVVIGDYLVIDAGLNKGVYPIYGVTPHNLTIAPAGFPSQPSLVDYRVTKQIDWTEQHKYSVNRTGDVVTLSLDDSLILTLDYDSLPVCSVGVVQSLASGLSAIAFGAFDPQNLSQSVWNYAHYGITKCPTESRIAPHHQVLNQWNAIASPEHLFTDIPHVHTGFESASTGIPPCTAPDFLQNPALPAFTNLGEGTPLVPVTQAFETRGIHTSEVPESRLNCINDTLNTDLNFTLNDTRTLLETIVPIDVLYSQIQVIERDIGSPGLIAPFWDNGFPYFGTFHYDARHCLDYKATVLPEDDPTAQTPWRRFSANPTQATASVTSGVLTYSIGGMGTTSRYENDTPLPCSPGLETTAMFKFKVLTDTTYGLGDTQIRVGLRTPGFMVGLGFGTTLEGERFVTVLDLNAPPDETKVLGSIPFDYLDGVEHTYKITKNLDHTAVHVSIDRTV